MCYLIFFVGIEYNAAFRSSSGFGRTSFHGSQLFGEIKSSEARRIVLPPKSDDYKWNLGKVAFSLLPLAPGDRRRTLMEEVVKNEIWTLDQLQGIINVNVPVRAVIIKLSTGGLFVYNPVAPTKECLDIIRDLEKKHGNVRHVVLGSLGLEHKAMAGPFSQYFPECIVWLQPGQWSFPINLPSSLLGFPSGERLKEIPESSLGSPWEADFDHCVLGPLRFKSVGKTVHLGRNVQKLMLCWTISDHKLLLANHFVQL